MAPASNLVVERMFSFITAIKTKPRNKTQIDLLDALVRIRLHLCNAFVAQILNVHQT